MSAVPPESGPDNSEQSRPPEQGKVGYKRPPREHQFPPGRSGNPHGRRKGAIGIKRALADELGSKVKVTIDKNGTKTTVSLSKLQYIVKLLVEKAIKGDRRSIEQLITLNMTIFGLGEDEGTAEAQLTPGEQAYLDAMRHQFSSGDMAAGHKADPGAVASEADDEDESDE